MRKAVDHGIETTNLSAMVSEERLDSSFKRKLTGALDFEATLPHRFQASIDEALRSKSSAFVRSMPGSSFVKMIERARNKGLDRFTQPATMQTRPASGKESPVNILKGIGQAELRSRRLQDEEAYRGLASPSSRPASQASVHSRAATSMANRTSMPGREEAAPHGASVPQETPTEGSADGQRASPTLSAIAFAKRVATIAGRRAAASACSTLPR